MKVEVGDKFNRFTVIGDGEMYISKNGRSKERTYKCRCDCGRIVDVRKGYLVHGVVKSCGCYRREFLENGLCHRKHGGWGTRLYKIWKTMRERCNTASCSSYFKYGGRGIQVCEEWDSFSKFREWAYENGYQDNLTIDRIDVNGNYEPSNCRWATAKEQANNKRGTIFYMFDGNPMTLSQISDLTGIPYKRLHQSIRTYKRTVEETVERFT